MVELIDRAQGTPLRSIPLHKLQGVVEVAVSCYSTNWPKLAIKAELRSRLREVGVASTPDAVDTIMSLARAQLGER